MGYSHNNLRMALGLEKKNEDRPSLQIPNEIRPEEIAMNQICNYIKRRRGRRINKDDEEIKIAQLRALRETQRNSHF